MNERLHMLGGDLHIGYSPEHDAREYRFSIGGYVSRWPDTTPVMLAVRPYEQDTYVVKTEIIDNVIVWKPTRYDTEIPGVGRMWVAFMGKDGKQLGLSPETIVRIKPGPPNIDGDTPPEKRPTWAQEVLDAAAVVENAAASVPETVREALQDAKESGDFKGDPGDPGEDGYTPVKGIDYFDGDDGKDGYTPQKGVDYFDGAPGPVGPAGYTPVKGVDYFDGNNGVDGYSPTITLTRTDKGVQIDVRNKDGTQSATVNDGKDGKDGTPGSGGAILDVIDDTEVLGALAENDLMLAVGSDEDVLCDENGNILEW